MIPTAAARSLACAQCGTPAGIACDPAPADHLGRFVDAWQAGLLGRAGLTAIVAALIVIAPSVLVPAASEPAEAAA